MPTYKTTITSRMDGARVNVNLVDGLTGGEWRCDSSGPFGATSGPARSFGTTEVFCQLKVGQMTLNDWKGAKVKGRGSVLENAGSFPDGEIDWEVTSISY